MSNMALRKTLEDEYSLPELNHVSKVGECAIKFTTDIEVFQYEALQNNYLSAGLVDQTIEEVD